jgi:hypothetical protein
MLWQLWQKFWSLANHAVVLPAGVALDAAIKAVIPGAYAFMHRFVALMLEQRHVVLAHELGALDAFLALAGFDHRLRHAAGVRGEHPALRLPAQR